MSMAVHPPNALLPLDPLIPLPFGPLDPLDPFAFVLTPRFVDLVLFALCDRVHSHSRSRSEDTSSPLPVVAVVPMLPDRATSALSTFTFDDEELADRECIDRRPFILTLPTFHGEDKEEEPALSLLALHPFLEDTVGPSDRCRPQHRSTELEVAGRDRLEPSAPIVVP